MEATRNNLVKACFLFIAYLTAMIGANYILFYFGKWGLLFSSFFLIPFDFTIRCFFHEYYKGNKLLLVQNMLIITFACSLCTFTFNHETRDIAVASSVGFITAQVFAGLFYQLTIRQHSFIKVNGSDIIGLTADSIVFQLIAFSALDPMLTLSQICLKATGGILWYYILIKWLKLIRYDNEQK